MTGPVPLQVEIGEHVQKEFLGMTFNMDTIWTTLIAGAIVLILGFWARSALTKDSEDHVPSKIQVLWETIVGEVNRQVLDNLGRVHPFVVPLAVALFFFILIANWLELIPSQLNETSGHLLPAPTADTNLTYALAAVTIVSVWIYGIRTKGAKGYFKHFLEPYPVLLPLNILEELTKPITLALRLFGNIFAGGVLVHTMLGIAPFITFIFLGLELFVGVIQALIFTMLSLVFLSIANTGHGHDPGHPENTNETQEEEYAEMRHAESRAAHH